MNWPTPRFGSLGTGDESYDRTSASSILEKRTREILMTRAIKAITLPKNSGRMSVVETSEPRAKSGQILIEVKTSAINEMDVEVREGGWKRYVGKYRKQGRTLTGFEFAGVARSAGTRIREGQRVIGYVHVTNGPRTHADMVVVNENCVHVIPDDLSLEDAAAIVSMGLAAIDVFERLKPLEAQQHVLINGAAGGLGVYSVQMAKSQGAEVTAVCSEKNAEWMKTMGADHVRAYEHEDALRSGDQFDLILDVAQKLSFSRCRSALTPSGMYVATNPLADLWGFVRALASRRKAGFMLVLQTDPTKLGHLLELVEKKILRPVIDSRFPMDQINEAMDKFARSGKQGRVLLEFHKEVES